MNLIVVHPELPPLDDDLQAIIDAWPSLSDDVRRTLAGVVRLSIKKS